MPFHSSRQRRAAFAKMRGRVRLPTSEERALLREKGLRVAGAAKQDISRVTERGMSGLRRFYEATKTTYKPKKKRRGKV